MASPSLASLRSTMTCGSAVVIAALLYRPQPIAELAHSPQGNWLNRRLQNMRLVRRSIMTTGNCRFAWVPNKCHRRKGSTHSKRLESTDIGIAALSPGRHRRVATPISSIPATHPPWRKRIGHGAAQPEF
jgi:hypothetical protein